MATMMTTAATGSPGQEAREASLPHERRHGPRRSVRIPLLLDVGGLRDASWAVTANEGGALVTFPRPLPEGERVVIHNVTTGRTAVARVVTALLSDREPTGASTPGFRAALRLETFPEGFWGPLYYAAVEAERVH